MTKALKHSPEWVKFSKSKKDAEGKEIPIVPYSRRTSLQVHVKGRISNGKYAEAHYGKSDETLFVDLGNKIYDEPNLIGRAKLIHDAMILAPKIKEEYIPPQ